MKWPWEILMKSKDEHQQDRNEIIEPAQQAISNTDARVSRINRILAEAQQAERLVREAHDYRGQ